MNQYMFMQLPVAAQNSRTWFQTHRLSEPFDLASDLRRICVPSEHIKDTREPPYLLADALMVDTMILRLIVLLILGVMWPKVCMMRLNGKPL